MKTCAGTARRRPERALALAALLALAGCEPPGAVRPDARATPEAAEAVPPLQTKAAALQQRASEAYEAERWADASAAYAELTQLRPDIGEFWFRLGNARARQGDIPGSVAAYESAIRADAGLAKAWHNLGIVHLRAAVRSFSGLMQATSPGDALHEKGTAFSAGLADVLEARSAGSTARRTAPPPTPSAAPMAPAVEATEAVSDVDPVDDDVEVIYLSGDEESTSPADTTVPATPAAATTDEAEPEPELPPAPPMPAEDAPPAVAADEPDVDPEDDAPVPETGTAAIPEATPAPVTEEAAPTLATPSPSVAGREDDAPESATATEASPSTPTAAGAELPPAVPSVVDTEPESTVPPVPEMPAPDAETDAKAEVDADTGAVMAPPPDDEPVSIEALLESTGAQSAGDTEEPGAMPAPQAAPAPATEPPADTLEAETASLPDPDAGTEEGSAAPPADSAGSNLEATETPVPPGDETPGDPPAVAGTAGAGSVAPVGTPPPDATPQGMRAELPLPGDSDAARADDFAGALLREALDAPDGVKPEERAE